MSIVSGLGKKAVVLAFVSAAVFATNANAVSVRGFSSCGGWVQDRAENNGWPHLSDESWVLGFLSGLALGTKEDVLKRADDPSIFLWIDNYCQANPLKRVTDAVMELFSELAKQKHR